MKTLMIAHRGAQLIAPENTMTAFNLAIKKGFKAIECDVQQTKDGTLVIIHDQTVDRTTDGAGSVSNLKYSDLSKLSVSGSEHIPTLDEVVRDVVLKKKCKVIIEIKADTELHSKKVSLALAHYLDNLPRRYYSYIEVHSFWYGALTLFKTALPEITAASIIKGGFDSKHIIDIAHQSNSNGVSLGYEFVSKKIVRECHKANLFVDTWAIPDGTVLKRLKPMSLDGIIENFNDRRIRVGNKKF